MEQNANVAQEEMFDLDFRVEHSDSTGDVTPNTWHISILFSCTDCI